MGRGICDQNMAVRRDGERHSRGPTHGLGGQGTNVVVHRSRIRISGGTTNRIECLEFKGRFRRSSESPPV